MLLFLRSPSQFLGVRNIPVNIFILRSGLTVTELATVYCIDCFLNQHQPSGWRPSVFREVGTGLLNINLMNCRLQRVTVD
jgi:hypothetical protein